jgi:demethylmenaquinone methyltransferase/2-methoxy-6-polyprenyl-1,4-benzoquinol methylase
MRKYVEEKIASPTRAQYVEEMFGRIAPRYDLMNRVMTGGMDRRWRAIAVAETRLRRGGSALDVATGTGDLAVALARVAGPDGHVVGVDFTEEMLVLARHKGLTRGVKVEFQRADALALPFPDESFDAVTIGFGLRNVTDKDAALRSMLRVLKPGGRLLVLEFSKPISEPLSKIYDQYSFKVLPMLGRLVANDEGSYRYLAESIRMHPDQATLKKMMEDAGYSRVQVYNLTGGIVAVHRGFRLS